MLDKMLFVTILIGVGLSLLYLRGALRSLRVRRELGREDCLPRMEP